jgi:hypothetical protein
VWRKYRVDSGWFHFGGALVSGFVHGVVVDGTRTHVHGRCGMSAKRPTMADVVDAANTVLELVAEAEAEVDAHPYRRAQLFNIRRRALTTVRQELHTSSRGRRSFSISALQVEADWLRGDLKREIGA